MTWIRVKVTVFNAALFEAELVFRTVCKTDTDVNNFAEIQVRHYFRTVMYQIDSIERISDPTSK